MQVELQLDLQSAIQKAITPEALQPIIDKAVQSAVSSAINEATGYRSKFSESLKAQLAEAMPHGLDVRDVVKFQNVLNDAIAKLIGDANATSVETALKEAAKQVMPDVPATIKLSELVELAREGLHKEKDEAFYAFWNPGEYGGGWLYLDKDEKPGHSSTYSSYRDFDRYDVKYRASFHLAVTKEGEVYAMRLDGKTLTPSARPDIVGKFASYMMAMYVGRTRLEVDIDDDDVAAAAREQYED